MHLSKSQYVRGLQCHKSLWLYKHKKDEITPTDQRKQYVFDIGNRVGKLAHDLFPGGTEIEFSNDYDISRCGEGIFRLQKGKIYINLTVPFQALKAQC